MAKKPKKKRSAHAAKTVKPTGISLVDELAGLGESDCTIDAYVAAASEYVRRSGELGLGPKKGRSDQAI